MTQRLDTPVLRLLEADFSDIDEMCSAVRSWNLDFRPLAATANTDKVGRIIQSRCGSLEFAYARFSASIEQQGAPPAGLITFVVPESRIRRLWWRGHDVDQNTVLVFPIGSELKSFSGPDFEIHTISVSENTVAGVCERFQIKLPIARLRPEVFYPPRNLLNELRQRLRLLRDREIPGNAVESINILEGLVLAWLRNANPRPRQPSSLRARDRAIRQCLEFAEQADWTELSSGVLCEIGGISERTLQYAFRERFGLTPAAFVKARRLAAVRQALLNAADQGSMVGDISAAFGFWHVGQFASDYRRAFGETPSATLSRSKKLRLQARPALNQL